MTHGLSRPLAARNDSAGRIRTRRRWSRLLGALLALTVAVGTTVLVAAPAQGAPAPRAATATATAKAKAKAAAVEKTIVSLTFDDGNANQMDAASMLQTYGMRGTFYVNSGYVGSSGYLSLANLQALKAAGHEIGGHTVSHYDLTQLSTDEAKRQVCNDRVNFEQWGLPVASFAYPFASSNTAVENIARDCGYNSARGLGDIRSPASCANCPVAETIPPPYLWFTRAPDQVERNWTVAQLQQQVTQAESKGGWVQLTFHQICTGGLAKCPDPAFGPTKLATFLAWLQKRAATKGTVVKTVGQVIGGATKPAVPGSPTNPGGSATVQNPGLETFNASTGLPDCFMAGGYGSNTSTFATTTDAHGGSTAVKVTVANYVDGDAKLLPNLDLGTCAPAATAGTSYTLGQWYKSSAVTQFALYYRNASGTWVYWTSSPWFAAATAWTQATWTTPPVPTGATGISFGLNIFSNGTLTVDDFAMAPAASAAAAQLNASSAKAATVAPAPSAKAPAPSGPRKLVEDAGEGEQAPVVEQYRKGAAVTESNLVPGPQIVAPGDQFVVAQEPSRG
ncbi:polysaccharide deacetylase family protein [Nakamurella leprariae]|uniref:Polysaccharide deacetylase family protein n=1 Tax=Nakamurella leprariae TaxID=2803911 RepID=A0A938YC05_9ACTN|nr:polysaccharide deacetylase family protein [Nakamurella leprariae]MBM9467044.1 polysaccharide deacetylase family protein [Nakamurella leprariae]